MATDSFADARAGLSSPGEHAAAITPDDSNDMANTTRGIYVGGSGDLKVDMFGGETVTFTNLLAGVIHPIRAVRVYATGTTATTILGVW